MTWNITKNISSVYKRTYRADLQPALEQKELLSCNTHCMGQKIIGYRYD